VRAHTARNVAPWSNRDHPLEDLLATVPGSLTEHALGLHSCGLLTMQAVGASVAGACRRLAVADHDGAFLAVASIAVTRIVAPDAPAAREDVENARPAPLTT
jgi:hypothetical protein